MLYMRWVLCEYLKERNDKLDYLSCTCHPLRWATSLKAVLHACIFLPPLLQVSFISLKNKYLIKKKLLLPYSSITQHIQDFPPTLPSKFFKIAQLYQILKNVETIWYTWNSTISMQMTQPCYYWHFKTS